jgi:hypothetical protein
MIHHFPSRDLDVALREWRSPGDTIILDEGEYITRGSGAFSDGVGFAPGVTVDASRARIILKNPAPTNRPWVDHPWRGEGSRVIGGDWDLGNHGGIAQSGFRAVGTAHQDGGILRGLLGRRVASDSFPQKEVFAWCQERGTGGTTLKDLIAHPLNKERDNYVAGIYTNDLDSVVSGCKMPLGPHAQFAYSCVHRTHFIDCDGEGMRIFYTDTEGAAAILTRVNGTATWAAIGFAGTLGQMAPPRTVWAEDCEIAAPEARLVEFDDTEGPQRCTVLISGGKWVGRWRLSSNSPGSQLVVFGADMQFDLDHLPTGAPAPIIL